MTNRLTHALLCYVRYPAWALLVYGFSAGMPFKVLFAIFGLYLRGLGFDLTTITLFSLLGLFFSLKFVWSPILDQPPLGKLARTFGVRRASLLVIQWSLFASFVLLGAVDPHQWWWGFVSLVCLIAFLSASQDIVIDALRIELMPIRYQGILSTNYLIGYRVGLIAGASVPLYVAEITGSWSLGFISIALMLLPSLLTTLLISEPEHERTSAPRRLPELWQLLIDAFNEFRRRYQPYLLSIVALVLFYRFCDLLLGVVAYPFYYDLGYSAIEIANYSGVMGVIVTLCGGLIGGYALLHCRWRPLMMTGLLLAALSNLAFAALALMGQADQLYPLVLAIAADNLAGGMATAFFIAWLSSLVNLKFTVVQYALLSSLATLPGKLLGGGSGWLIDSLNHWIISARDGGETLYAVLPEQSLMSAYLLFFLLSTLVALPVMAVVLRLPESVVQPK